MIKKYNKFFESIVEDSTVYEWRSLLLNRVSTNFDSYAEKYIGKGYSKIIHRRVDEIFSILDNVDMNDIDGLFVDFQDLHSIYRASKLILYSNYYEYENKYNGSYNVVREDLKYYLALNAINPILEYLHDSYNCENFSINRVNVIHQTNLTIERLKLYNVDKILSYCKAGLILTLGNSDIAYDEKVNIDDVERILDYKEPMVTDYFDSIGIESKFIFDYSRGKRMFKDKEFSDYQLKIILE